MKAVLKFCMVENGEQYIIFRISTMPKWSAENWGFLELSLLPNMLTLGKEVDPFGSPMYNAWGMRVDSVTVFTVDGTIMKPTTIMMQE